MTYHRVLPRDAFNEAKLLKCIGKLTLLIEDKYNTPKAASLIYAKSDPNIGQMPNFYCDNETALADMKARAEQEKAGVKC